MKQKQDFTIVELLVVISIISILASMLLPALGKAQKVAFSASCRNRQKQLLLTTNMYMLDNDDHIWRETWVGSGFVWTQAFEAAGLVEDWNMLLCPGWEPKSGKITDLHARYRTYGIADWKDDWLKRASIPGGTANLMVTRRVERPSEAILFADSVSRLDFGFGLQNWIFKCRPHEGALVHMRHNNKANFSFLDGHAGTLSNGEIVKAIHYHEQPDPGGYPAVSVIYDYAIGNPVRLY